jgi:hypothetical protein
MNNPYIPTARLIIESHNGINMVAGITKIRGGFLKLRQVIAGNTVLNDQALPLYTIEMKKLDKVDNIDECAIYYIKEDNIMRISE